MVTTGFKGRYIALLKAYVAEPKEELLLSAADLGRVLVGAGANSEDITELHEEALNQLAQESPDLRLQDFAELTSKPIMEMSVAYGLAYREQLDARVEAEESVRQSEERYSTLFQDSGDGIFIINLDGTFVDVNQASLDIFGYTKEDLLKIKFADLYVDPIEREKYQGAIAESGSIKDYEIRMRKRDGTEIECLITSSARRSSDGTILGSQGIVRDVTVQKREHQELNQKIRELQALNKQFQEYLAESYATVDSYKEISAVLQALMQEVQALYEGDQGQSLMGDTERQSINSLQELAIKANALLQKAQSPRTPI